MYLITETYNLESYYMFLWILLLIVIVFFPWKEGLTQAEIKTKMESNYGKIARYLNAVDGMVGKL